MITCWFCIKIFTLKLYHLDFICLKENVIKDLLSAVTEASFSKLIRKLIQHSPVHRMSHLEWIQLFWGSGFFQPFQGHFHVGVTSGKLCLNYTRFLTLVFTFQSHYLSSLFLTFFKNCTFFQKLLSPQFNEIASLSRSGISLIKMDGRND